MKCIIIEDEPPAIKVLEHYIAQVPNLFACGSFTDPLQGITAIQQQTVDLVFLDINMPKLSGIDLIKILQNPPAIIITTAYPEFAVEGFELEVTDYLLKPIAFQRFLKAINKVGKQAEKHTSELSKGQYLVLKSDRKLFKVNFEEILYLQAWGDYVKIICRDRTLLPKETLTKVAERLPTERFVRIHRSYIVAIEAIAFIEGNQVAIGNTKLPVSQSYKENLLKIFS